jgi:hypothetical protein
MGIQKLIPIAVTLAFLAVSTGQLPKVLKTVRIAQLQPIKDSQASNWPKAMTLPSGLLYLIDITSSLDSGVLFGVRWSNRLLSGGKK